MRKISMLVVMLGVLLSYTVAFAMDMDHSKMDHSKMDHGEKKDDNVVEQDGYNVKFDFIDLKAKMKDMDMGGKTHHLMVFIEDADAKKVTDAKVKFKIFSPTKKESSAMAMKMGDGFGADIDLSEKGKHGVAVLIKIGEKSVLVKTHHETK